MPQFLLFMWVLGTQAQIFTLTLQALLPNELFSLESESPDTPTSLPNLREFINRPIPYAVPPSINVSECLTPCLVRGKNIDLGTTDDLSSVQHRVPKLG